MSKIVCSDMETMIIRVNVKSNNLVVPQTFRHSLEIPIPPLLYLRDNLRYHSCTVYSRYTVYVITLVMADSLR